MSSQLLPIDNDENLWVRVLLAEDISLCEIDIAGKIQLWASGISHNRLVETEYSLGISRAKVISS